MANNKNNAKPIQTGAGIDESNAPKEAPLITTTAIPINKVKAYLQERGMDPEHFGWEGLQDEYWEK